MNTVDRPQGPGEVSIPRA